MDDWKCHVDMFHYSGAVCCCFGVWFEGVREVTMGGLLEDGVIFVVCVMVRNEEHAKGSC